MSVSSVFVWIFLNDATKTFEMQKRLMGARKTCCTGYTPFAERFANRKENQVIREAYIIRCAGMPWWNSACLILWIF